MTSNELVGNLGAPDPAATRPPRIWRESIAIAAILVAASAVVFYDVWFQGRTLRASNTLPSALPSGHFGETAPGPRSMSLYDVTPAVLEEPYLELKRRAFAHGDLPLWNPHQAGGYPFLATMESSLFFLPDLLLFAAPPRLAWDLFLLARLVAAGLASYWLLRVLGFERLAAGAAGVAYAFSGPLVSWVANVTTNADVLLPLLLLALEQVLRSPHRRWVVLAAFVTFQVVAGGHPEHAFLALLSGALYAGCRVVQGAAVGGRGAGALRLGGAIAAGLGLAAVQIAPFAEYLANAWHIHGPRTGLQSLGLRELATVLFPRYDSRELVSYAGWTFNTWPGGWLGVVSVALALATMLLRRVPAAARPFHLLFLLYAAKLFGVPPVAWLGYLPVFEIVRFPLHATQNLAFATAMLCGVAVAVLCRQDAEFRAFGAALGVVALAGVALALVRPPRSAPEVVWGVGVAAAAALALALAARARRLVPSRVLAAVAVLSLFAELALSAPHERPRRGDTFRVPPYVEFLREQPGRFRVFGIGGCLYPDSATAFGLDDLGIYEGLFVDRFAKFVHTLVDHQAFAEGSFHAFRGSLPNPANRSLDLLNLRYLVMPVGARVPPDRLEPLGLRSVYQGEVQILERLHAQPRATVRTAVDFVPDGAAALARLAAGYDFERRVLVEGEPSSPAQGGSNGGGEVEELAYELDRKSYRVRCTGACYLVVADVHYPGWRARVDGRRRPVLRADYLFQAVALEAGDHEVALEFRPVSVLAGAAISVSTLALLIGWAGLAALRTRGSAAEEVEQEPTDARRLVEVDPVAGAGDAHDVDLAAERRRRLDQGGRERGVFEPPEDPHRRLDDDAGRAGRRTP